MSAEDPANGSAADGGNTDAIADAPVSEIDELEDEIELLRRDNRNILQDLQDMKEAERRARSTLNKLQHMSKSQTAVFRAYAGQKLSDALQILDDAISIARPAGVLDVGQSLQLVAGDENPMASSDAVSQRALVASYIASDDTV